ncbi:MAG: hypothetical protein KGJ77_08325 [Acidobacteriota bacterium]|nr:hypothetical protein [Acidobacteriota bacterium]
MEVHGEGRSTRRWMYILIGVVIVVVAAIPGIVVHPVLGVIVFAAALWGSRPHE